jgi:hypothetical protein
MFRSFALPGDDRVSQGTVGADRGAVSAECGNGHGAYRAAVYGGANLAAGVGEFAPEQIEVPYEP